MRHLTAAALTSLALVAALSPTRARAGDDLYGVYRLKSGIVLPYPLDNPFRGFADCRRGRHHHRALDIGGVGPDYGLGTPVRSIFHARVLAMGSPEDDPARWGHRLKGPRTVTRGRRVLPTSKEVPGYGRVWFFTKDYGRSRTGVFIRTRVLDGRHKGYIVTYMHLGAVHPDLKVGSVLQAGQELGVMGGTAVLESGPHVHVQIRSRRGKAVDVGPLLGIGKTSARCRGGKRAERALRARYSKNAVKLMATLRRKKARIWRAPEAIGCGSWTYEGDFSSGSFWRHRFALPSAGASRGAAWEIELRRLEGKWQPRLRLEDLGERTLYRGSTGPKDAARSLRLKRLANGRRGAVAKLRLQPRRATDLAIVVGRWRDRRLPRGARYRLTVTRPCAATTDASGATEPSAP